MDEVVEDRRSRRAPGTAPDSFYHTNSAAGPDLCTPPSQRSRWSPTYARSAHCPQRTIAALVWCATWSAAGNRAGTF